MFEQEYAITLLSDVVVTANAATVGGHQGLDHLPGSLFLGAAAGSSIRKGAAFDPHFFLSGRVRFLDAYPLAEGNPTLPIPFSFHRIKGEDWRGKHPVNLLEDVPLKDGEQINQWREGYLSESGVIAKPGLESRMKTAIDRENRRSAEGQLFGYQSIPAGSKFRMKVQADRQEDLKTVAEWFEQGSLRLGRSRSAEYGQVKITPVESQPAESSAQTPEGWVVLYLKSDLALSRQGMPVLTPSGEDFGLPGATLIPKRTFLRSRSYSPWNAFFNCRMEERQVLCKGSILTFRLASRPSLEEIRSNLSRGVGLHREEGLGQILVNPAFLLSPPKLREAASSPEEPVYVTAPSSTLAKYLLNRTELRESARQSFQSGLELARIWHALSRKIERDGQKVPGKSQWASIRELAVRFRHNPEEFLPKLQTYCKEDLRQKLWVGATTRSGGKSQNLYEAIEEALGKNPTTTGIMAVYHAAVEMGRMLSGGEDRKGGNHR